MLLKKFISALKPKISKVDVLSELTIQRKELTMNVIPQYNEFNKAFSHYDFKSPVLVSIDTKYRRRIQTSGKTSLFIEIEKMLLVVATNLSVIENDIDRYISDVVYKDALNLVQANIIQYISACGFVIRYARNLMTLALIEEAQSLDQGSYIKMPAVEATRLTEQSGKFVNTLVSVSQSTKIVREKLTSIPDVFASEETLAMNQANRDVVDPFNLNLLDSGFNPIFLYGIISAERDASNYMESREDFEVQQSLLLNLKLAQSRQNDPKLELKIQRQIERVQTIRRKLDDMERKYGLKE